MYLGDFRPGDTINFKFTTVNSSGVPTQLAGTPALSVYKSNGTTETTAGITLTVDFDARTGLNHVLIALTDSFYVARSDYQVVITTGTVGGSSVVGYVVAHFSILNRSHTRAIGHGVVGASASSTSIPTSSLDPAAEVLDQFKGRVVIFDDNTTTTNLRGQATKITSSSALGVLTVEALTTAPASGDTFKVF